MQWREFREIIEFEHLFNSTGHKYLARVFSIQLKQEMSIHNFKIQLIVSNGQHGPEDDCSDSLYIQQKQTKHCGERNILTFDTFSVAKGKDAYFRILVLNKDDPTEVYRSHLFKIFARKGLQHDIQKIGWRSTESTITKHTQRASRVKSWHSSVTIPHPHLTLPTRQQHEQKQSQQNPQQQQQQKRAKPKENEEADDESDQ